MSTTKKHFDPPYIDEEEKDIIESFKTGGFKLVEDLQKAKKEHEKAASNTLKKRPINIRLQENDIKKIKSIAKEDGIPYQTLISSIVHRYANGTLKRA